MSERNQRVMGWIEVVVVLALLVYMALNIALMVRGDLVVGPGRVLTAVMNAVGGVALLALGVINLRRPSHP